MLRIPVLMAMGVGVLLAAGSSFVCAQAAKDAASRDAARAATAPSAAKQSAADGASQKSATIRNKATAKSAESTRRKNTPGITPEREAAVRTFLSQHHAELLPVIQRLKKSNKAHYAKAIRDLLRQSERLANWQERDMERYVLELSAWKATSRVQLLAAKIKANKTPALVSELEAAVAAQYEMRIQLLRMERDRAQDRLHKLSDQLDKMEQGKSRTVKSQVNMLTKEPVAKSAAGSKAKSQKTPTSQPVKQNTPSKSSSPAT